jgi:hypothetical protein
MYLSVCISTYIHTHMYLYFHMCGGMSYLFEGFRCGTSAAAAAVTERGGGAGGWAGIVCCESIHNIYIYIYMYSILYMRYSIFGAFGLKACICPKEEQWRRDYVFRFYVHIQLKIDL